MPRRRNPSEEREENEPEESGTPENKRREDEGRPRRRRMGREHAVHEQIVDRRLGGGEPATPEAYAKALEEWHRLPGAVMRPPTDEKPATKTAPEGTDEGDKENPA